MLVKYKQTFCYLVAHFLSKSFQEHLAVIPEPCLTKYRLTQRHLQPEGKFIRLMCCSAFWLFCVCVSFLWF